MNDRGGIHVSFTKFCFVIFFFLVNILFYNVGMCSESHRYRTHALTFKPTILSFVIIIVHGPDIHHTHRSQANNGQSISRHAQIAQNWKCGTMLGYLQTRETYSSSFKQSSWTNSSINLATLLGFSTWGRWPQPGIWRMVAFGSSRCNLCMMMNID